MKPNSYPLRNGENGVKDILSGLEKEREKAGNDIRIRQATISILPNLDDNDVNGQIKAVEMFVKKHLKYLNDPLGFQYVTRPKELLDSIFERGYAFGNCDDHALLFNSMIDSIGLETGFVAVKLDNAENFNHVVSVVGNGPEWKIIDLCAKQTAQPTYNERIYSTREKPMRNQYLAQSTDDPYGFGINPINTPSLPISPGVTVTPQRSMFGLSTLNWLPDPIAQVGEVALNFWAQDELFNMQQDRLEALADAKMQSMDSANQLAEAQRQVDELTAISAMQSKQIAETQIAEIEKRQATNLAVPLAIGAAIFVLAMATKDKR